MFNVRFKGVLFKCIGLILLVILFLLCTQAQFPAYRICKPGPALPNPVNSTLKNCLIIGDSVSIGYTPYAKNMLSDMCQVQHAPWDTSDGGALDTKYALQCLSLFLSTAQGQSTKYDAIIFNFGLHDVQYCPGNYSEEYTPYKEYLSNIMFITSRLNLTGAKLGFVLSTPIPYSVMLNDRVKKYNSGIKQILNDTGIKVIDLYEKVVDICGEPPFKSCFIMREQPNVHYSPTGYTYLGVFVSKLFISLLDQVPKYPVNVHSQLKVNKVTKKMKTNEKLMQGWHVCNKENFLTKSELESNVVKQPSKNPSCQIFPAKRQYTAYNVNMTTSCPQSMTCCKDVFSSTGIGCCVIPDANPCTDGLHCCPHGMTCSDDCEKGIGLCYCFTEKSKKMNEKVSKNMRSKKIVKN